MSIEAMKQALEALDNLARYADTCELFLKETHPGKANALGKRVKNSIEIITSLRQAIEQAEKQEPVAWQDTRKTWVDVPLKNVLNEKREWVGLTDEDIEQEFGFIDELLRDCVCRTEAKLKEKNT
jgi:hypothetical protein